MVRPTVKPTKHFKRKQVQLTRRAKKGAKWGKKKETTRRNPSQCGFGARSRRVDGDLSPWRSVGSLYGSWPLAVQLLKDYTAPYFDQVPYHPSFSLNKSLHQSRFFLPCFQSKLEDFFIDNIYILWSFGFLPQFPSSVGKFFIDWSLVPVFLLSLPELGWDVFYRSHDPLRLISFPTGLGCFHLPPIFLFSLSHMIGRFFTKFSFINRQFPRSTELVSKKEGNCNVMVTESW